MNRSLNFLVCVALGVLAVFLVGLITMSLWNWLVPAIFSGPLVTFWQALGLLLLSKLLFWGFGGKRQWNNSRPDIPWKVKFYNKFSSMTPEERELVKQKMKEKWCSWEKKAATRNSSDSID